MIWRSTIPEMAGSFVRSAPSDQESALGRGPVYTTGLVSTATSAENVGFSAPSSLEVLGRKTPLGELSLSKREE